MRALRRAHLKGPEMKHKLPLILFIATGVMGLLAAWAVTAHAAPAQGITESVAVCDPWQPQNCSAPLANVSAGASQLGATITSALAPTIPAGTEEIIVIPQGTNNAAGACLLWRDDGVAPTTTVGVPIPAYQPYVYVIKSMPTSSAINPNFEVIQAASATCTANFVFYK